MHNPIAYTYEADHHCPSCTIARFGADALGVDNEGNEVGAVFPWDEWWNMTDERDYLACGDCAYIIATAGPSEEAVKSDGYSSGQSAATWFEIRDGASQAAHVLRMIEDGDPEWYDQTPSPLSGEWADDPSPRDILQRFNVNEEDDDASQILDLWELAWQEGYEAEIVRVCKVSVES